MSAITKNEWSIQTRRVNIHGLYYIGIFACKAFHTTDERM